VYDKSTAPFLSCLAKKLVDMSGDSSERQWFHHRLSPWLQSEGTLLAYWSVTKFDLILAILGEVTSVAARHLPLQ